MLEKASFRASCDRKIDEITIELLDADVTDKDQIRILTENYGRLQDAKKHGKGRLMKWLTLLSPGDILKWYASEKMFDRILNKEEEGIVVTTRAKDWIPWNRSPR